jgi:predicted alpha-1,2-mannosidase
MSWAIFDHNYYSFMVESGTSFTGMEDAELNMKNEIPWTLPKDKLINMVSKTKTVWEDVLKSIIIRPLYQDPGELKTQFYSALYHTMVAPRLFSDADRQFVPFASTTNSTSRLDDDSEYYTDFSAWDTFRALHPLLLLVSPKRTRDMVKSLISMGFQNDEGLPKFPAWNAESMAMIGDHCIVIIADAIHKGIFSGTYKSELLIKKGVDLIMQARMLSKSNRSRSQPGMRPYIDLGFIPKSKKVKQYISTSLEYAYDDAIAAGAAVLVSANTEANVLFERSKSYRNIFNHTNKLFIPRDEESTIDPNTYKYKWLTEGTPMQWLLGAVQHDFLSLVKLIGGANETELLLDQFFGLSESGVHVNIDSSLSQYWHGNEPNHHVPFLYNMLGRSWKTQAIVRNLIAVEYSSRVGGLPGNEDAGQMSAWLIWAMLGLYPVVPGSQTPWYTLSSPAVRDAKIRLPLPGNRTHHFHIHAKKNSAENIFINAVYLDGTVLDRNWILHSELMVKTNLTMVMSSMPYRGWPSENAENPPKTVSL